MLTLLMAALIGASHPMPAAQAPDTDQTVAVEKGARLTLDNDAGEIIVRGWDRSEVRVQARHSSRTTVRVRANGPAVTISSRGGGMAVASSVDYDITVPRWMPVKLSGMGAYIQVEDLQADVSAETMRGDVVIRNVTGTITAESVEGEIAVERATGRVQATSVNRAIVLSDITGEIVAESISGGVRMSSIRSRNVEVNAISGGITFAGEIARDGSYRLMTHSGGIVVTAPTLDATITVRMFSGRFESAFPTEQVGTPRRGQAVTHVAGSGQARLVLESFSGSVRIRRADK